MPGRPIRTFTVLPHLPERLQALQKLAYNLWWCWNHEAVALFARIDAEFGLHESVPIYSGGLGVLAGDHLKAASDLGLPLVGVGLMYREGYFRQYLNIDGWQQESYPENDFFNLPLVPETLPDGAPLLVPVPLPGRGETLVR